MQFEGITLLHSEQVRIRCAGSSSMSYELRDQTALDVAQSDLSGTKGHVKLT